MSRPESISDLNSNDHTHTVATFDQSYFPTNPTFYTAFGNFLAQTEKLNLVTTKSYSTITVSKPYTKPELEEALELAQRRYDENLAEATSPNPPKNAWRRNSLLQFAKDENLPTPTWSEENV